MVKSVDCLLFSILVLGCFTDLRGNLWRRNLSHLYAVEVTLADVAEENCHATRCLLQFLPPIMCIGPQEVTKERGVLSVCTYTSTGQLDQKKFSSQTYQLVYQYLKRYHSNMREFNNFRFIPGKTEGRKQDFVKCIFK